MIVAGFSAKGESLLWMLAVANRVLTFRTYGAKIRSLSIGSGSWLRCCRAS